MYIGSQCTPFLLQILKIKLINKLRVYRSTRVCSNRLENLDFIWYICLRGVDHILIINYVEL